MQQIIPVAKLQSQQEGAWPPSTLSIGKLPSGVDPMAQVMTISEQAHRTPQSVFPVSLIFSIGRSEVRAHFDPEGVDLSGEAPVPGHDETFRFSVECVDGAEELSNLLALYRLKEKPVQLLVISDHLAEIDGSGKARPGPIVATILDQFRFSPHSCGLIALVGRVPGRISEIDRVVSWADDRTALRQAILQAAMGLRLRAKPPVRPSDAAPKDVKIEVVQSREQLKECFALRREVYGLMGYLPDAIMRDRSGIELDGYDERSIHFAAMRGGEVIGTVRMVLELLPTSSGGGLSCRSVRCLNTQEDHASWCREIAEKAGPAIRNRFHYPYFMPLPILESTELDRRWSRVLENAYPVVELSRLVVRMDYRGFRISRDLVHAVVAKACEMQRRVILLECIPKHVDMYAKLGFEQMQGEPHSRPIDLDQYAVAMWLRLDQRERVADAAEYLLAKIKMELHPRFGAFDTKMG